MTDTEFVIFVSTVAYWWLVAGFIAMALRAVEIVIHPTKTFPDEDFFASGFFWRLAGGPLALVISAFKVIFLFGMWSAVFVVKSQVEKEKDR